MAGIFAGIDAWCLKVANDVITGIGLGFSADSGGGSGAEVDLCGGKKECCLKNQWCLRKGRRRKERLRSAGCAFSDRRGPGKIILVISLCQVVFVFVCVKIIYQKVAKDARSVSGLKV